MQASITVGRGLRLWAIIANVQDESSNQLSLSLTAWALALVGWGGLVGLITTVDPRVGPLPVWGFFVLGLMALTGTAVPFVGYLNRRFVRGPVAAGILLRQSVWVGVFGATCAWLELRNLLSSTLAALVLIALIGAEWFLHLRERARWSPDSGSDESA